MTTQQIAQSVIDIELKESSSDYAMWNGKFYTTKDGETSIYVNNKKFDFTESYNALKDAKGFVYVSDFQNVVEELRQPVMENWYENN